MQTSTLMVFVVFLIIRYICGGGLLWVFFIYTIKCLFQHIFKGYFPEGMIGADVSVKLTHGSALLFHTVVYIQLDLNFCRSAGFRSWSFSRMSLSCVLFPVLSFLHISFFQSLSVEIESKCIPP